jgi:hypothetical protein
MFWISLIMLIVIIWGGASIANSLHQLARDVEGIKELLARAENQKTNQK